MRSAILLVCAVAYPVIAGSLFDTLMSGRALEDRSRQALIASILVALGWPILASILIIEALGELGSDLGRKVRGWRRP